MSLLNLHKIIEEIYSYKYFKDTQFIKQQINRSTSSSSLPDRPFPNIVFEFLEAKYKHAKILTQNCLDLAASVDFHKQESPEVHLFYQFLTLKTDNKELLFYLYVRSMVEKEMGVSFARVKDDMRGLSINVHKCEKVAKVLYGEDDLPASENEKLQ